MDDAISSCGLASGTIIDQESGEELKCFVSEVVRKGLGIEPKEETTTEITEERVHQPKDKGKRGCQIL